MRISKACLLTVVVAAGCATSRPAAGPAHHGSVTEVRAALAAGQTERALVELDKLQRFYADRPPDSVTLMLAEARLRQGEASAALALARGTLEKGSPAAQTVAGKALLKLGRYGEAEESFRAAQDGYGRGSAAYGQLEDFVSLSRGLEAYANADPDVAREYWDSIRDQQLRFAIDQAVRDLSRGPRTALR